MWVKKRHYITFCILKPFLKIYLFFKYNYKTEKYKGKEPVLILSNHSADADFFLITMAFKKQIYFLASDDIFTGGFFSKALSFLVNPIPKMKSVQDIEAIKNCFRVAKQNGSVCIFPEGNRTFSGDLCTVDETIGKLAKKIDLDIVVFAISGGYQTCPRFGAKNRRGKSFGKIARVITKEEKESMSSLELSKIIIDNMKVDLLDNIKFKGNYKAEYLERTIYHCDKCGNLNTLFSIKNDFKCSSCNNHYKFDEYSYLLQGEKRITVNDLYKIQESKIRSLSLDDINKLSFSDKGILFYHKKGMSKKELIGDVVIKLENGTITIGDISFKFDECHASTIVGKKKINFYIGDKTYQFKGDTRFCGVKYMNILYHNKNIKENNINGHLGL